MGTFVVRGKVSLKGENDMPDYLLCMNAWLG